MKIISPSYTIETPREWIAQAFPIIERAARTCYKSEDKMCDGSAVPFLKKLMSMTPPHESVLEHFSITVRFVCDRAIANELVRHRMASFSQESTRFISYAKEKHGGEITVIKPPFWKEGATAATWRDACLAAEQAYMDLLAMGAKPEQARAVLPLCLKTELVMTANLRSWRNILAQRTAPMAHPQMRELMIPLGKELKGLVPVVFDDIETL